MKKIYVLSILLFGMFSCSQNLTDLNVDNKNPREVEADVLFANATSELFDFMASTNVNINNFRLWAQQWAQTTYADESNYELSERRVDERAWNTLYATVIRDLKEAKTLWAEKELSPAFLEEHQRNQIAMAEVMEIFAWHLLVDIFGDIPYTAAFTDDVTPAYDDDAAIYADLAARLDAAIGKLSGASVVGSSDLVYGGDVAKWKKMANTLKVRMGIRMADMNNATAKQMVEAALSSGVFESSDDDFRLHYTSSTPHTNPLWVDLVQSGRSDFVAANTIVDKMNALEDPRLPYFFEDQYEVVIDTNTGETAIQFLGGIYGDNNNYNSFSHPGELQKMPTFSHSILDYTELSFLLADAAERGYSVGKSAEEYYNQGITSSILEWGGTTAEANTYLANPDVAYSTAQGDWKEKIALQKWLAMYNRGFEAWTTWRVYDAPELNIAAQAGTLPPTRYTYPTSEYSLNGDNVEAASGAIGGNTKFVKVFWDMN
ncbi:MAG: SusD/RagB family nutrient-binding outer membrane lipoprotein [Phaeodactylibacter sp.]|nr:SusD/RagB family nutrient-binding outer membrane lipoprotein [Phaeodactylibacter sp.]MCB9264599.1 SusD/RagB family nutrient-binding outer membrane lipoprotein [Lewinellaceae bacterium]MCB9287298.1 SusD/RagB family nutrient-binding outer membrane lipoprotein [Lewinellaceae bacterium]